MKVLQLHEHVTPGRRLGRHVEHDPRSRNYAFCAPRMAYTDVNHVINIPVLNQGALGACTGFAIEACCGARPFYDAIPSTVAAKPSMDVMVAQTQAIALYSTATSLDTFYGEYPPTDTGSTGLAAAKAAQRAGLISGYLHTFTLDDCLKALTLTPVIIGVNWYSGFDRPAADGLVRVSGSVRGGHEFLLYGIDATKKVVKARNSWGTSWGNKGNFYFSFDNLGRLLSEQGDCTVPVPLTSPSPTPSPTPTPTPSGPTLTPDEMLAAAFDVWKKAKGL